MKIQRDNLESALNALNTAVLEDDEYIFLEEYFEVLTPVAVALRTLEANKYTFGLYLPVLVGLRKALNRLHTKNLMHCKPLIAALQTGFEERFAKFMNIFNESLSVPLYLSMISNPMYKMDYLGFEQRVPAHYITRIRNWLMAEAKKIMEDGNESNIIELLESDDETSSDTQNQNDAHAQQTSSGIRN